MLGIQILAEAGKPFRAHASANRATLKLLALHEPMTPPVRSMLAQKCFLRWRLGLNWRGEVFQTSGILFCLRLSLIKRTAQPRLQARGHRNAVARRPGLQSWKTGCMHSIAQQGHKLLRSDGLGCC